MTTTVEGNRRTIVLVGAFIAFVLGVAAVGTFVQFYVDILWHRESGYISVFWTRVFWSWGVRIGATCVAALIFFVNLRWVVRTLGTIQIRQRLGNLEISQELPRGYVVLGLGVLSTLLGLWLGATVSEDAGVLLRVALAGDAWGVVEPVHGMDAAFYVFVLPLLRIAITFALVGTFLVLSAVTAGYVATGAVRWDRRGVTTSHASRRHIGLIAATFFILLAGQFWLTRYMLVQFGNSDVQGIFGFADAQARLPAMQFMTFLAVVSAGLVLAGAWQNRMATIAGGLIAVVVGGFGVGQLYPSLVQRLRVAPNELAREAPYILDNIEFTRLGFGLHELQREPFPYQLPTSSDGADAVDWNEALDQFSGLPVWTRNTLRTTFDALETIRAYYHFPTVAIDRYEGPDGIPVPVAVAVREVNPLAIEDQNWQNLYIRPIYYSGDGAAVAAVARRTNEGRPAMLQRANTGSLDLGPDTPIGLAVQSRSVFVGDARFTQEYAILNWDPVSDGGTGDPAAIGTTGPSSTESVGQGSVEGRTRVSGQPGVDFPSGIRIGSGLRKLALAWRFRDADLLFANEVGPESRFVFRRSVLERVLEIAPFFHYLDRPYPVVHEGRVVWIVEGFTSTRWFPLASAAQIDRRVVNYIRNSVKATVDGVTGEVRFYALPEPDPMLDAYRTAFPDLVRPFSDFPEELAEHLRYSKAHQTLQAGILLQYHQSTAEEFHGSRAVWDHPRELGENGETVPYSAEYGVYRLPNADAKDFYLTSAFVPLGRQNLAAIMTGKIQADGARELRLFDVPLEELVPGPRQVEALIEQDPEISQQFSLWRQGGSEVWTGHVHLVPVRGAILYMEAVFLAAEADAIPQLQGFVVSDGNRVAMEPTLLQAIEAVSGTLVDSPSGGGSAQTLDLEGATTGWPREALDLLNDAEGRLRSGDFAGFGEALAELRNLLQRAGSSAQTPGGAAR